MKTSEKKLGRIYIAVLIKAVMKYVKQFNIVLLNFVNVQDIYLYIFYFLNFIYYYFERVSNE